MATGEEQCLDSYSCQLCKAIDTEEMVQCDMCDHWFHYACVGVFEDVANRDWLCPSCSKIQKAIQDLENKHKHKTACSHVSSRVSSKRSLTSRQKVTLEMLEEEQKIRLDVLSKKYRVLEPVESDDESRDDEKQSSVDYGQKWEQRIQSISKDLKNLTMFDMPDDISISISDREREVVNKFSGAQLKEKLVGANRQDFILKSSVLAGQQQQQIRHSKSTDRQQATNVERGVENAGFQEFFHKYWNNAKFGRVDESKGAIPKTYHRMDPGTQSYFPKQVLEPQEHEVTFNAPPIGAQQNRRSTFSNFGARTPISNERTNRPFDWDKFNNSRRPIGTQSIQTPIVQPLISTPIRTNAAQQVVRLSGYNSNPVGVPLTQSQIASRHVFKDLPEFWGKAENWPLFLSSLKTSTEECGFSDGENLGRLIKALKGDALDVVKSSLVHASAVPDAVETLHLIFGRPNLIIHEMLEKIIETPSPKNDNLGSLIKFAIAVKNLCATIELSGDLNYLQNPLLIQKLIDKLPTQNQLDWAYFKFGAGQVDLLVFGQWLYRLAQVATDVINPATLKFGEKRDRKNDGNRSKPSGHVNAQSETQTVSNVTSTAIKSVTCHACGAEPVNKNREPVHKLENCKKFKEMAIDERWSLIKKVRICGSCFGNHHYFKCPAKKKCGKDGCTASHHSMLHNTPKKVDVKSVSISEVASQNSHRSICTTIKYPDIFRIVPVILSYSGQSIKIFAYLDDGSNLTSLEGKVADKIGATGTKSSLCVKWALGNNQVESNSRQISIQISGVFDGAEQFTLDHVRTVKQLFLPSQTITKRWLKQYSYFDNIPITTYNQATPQIIIGLQYSKLMVSLETIEGNWTEPIACKTRLGWVVQGPNNKCLRSDFLQKYGLNQCECQLVDNMLHQLVKQFFSIENFGVKASTMVMDPKDLIRAKQLLDSTIQRKGQRFESALLWRKEEIQLPNSYSMALRRLECVEAKMKRNPVLAERMCDYIADFIHKGYIRKLSESEKEIHEKLRVVWDGSAKVNGQSLNSNLLVGPDLLVPLPDILKRFRQRKIGITGDIKEMFHQILVCEDDHNSQRFLWRDGNSSVGPDTYVMQVMTFGSSCSPSIAQFIKNKNAMDFIGKYPRAVEAITKSHYVDDLIDNTHTSDEAIQLINEIQLIHRNAGFELRNFLSNSPDVLSALNGDTRDKTKMLHDKATITTERVLGMYWHTDRDAFTYCLKFVHFDAHTDTFVPTKREVLRTVMSIFDPLGFLAHFVVYAKIILQEIWRSKVNWDDPLPTSLRSKWSQWLKELPKVERVFIPRLYSTRMSPSPPISIQLHLFVDAGLEAFAAVAYFRIEDNFGVDSCLVEAKTRVAPIKPLSVPRLELQGGVLGTRLANSIHNSHYGIQIDKTLIWCDSRTVLSWLKSDLRKYNQFVTFRVAEILDSSVNIDWRWIPSSQNVADEATKSKHQGREIIANVETSKRWYDGPEFLRDSDSNWSFELEPPEFETNEEIRTLYLLAHLEIPIDKFIDFQRFSNWQRLVRTTAYVLRFLHNTRVEFDQRYFDVFSQDELMSAEMLLYKKIQFDSFQEELVIIRHNDNASVQQQKDMPKTSTIRLCSAYIDDFGVMRMKGRIDAAMISDTAKRPIILSRHHYVTQLLVYSYHHKYKHQHHQTVLNEVQQKYWIPQLRVLLGVIRNNCQKCKNTAAKPRVPEMAPLPEARLAVHTRPFTYVGIDYFGPIKVIQGRATVKRWGVLITCFTTRAVHLEIAHSLDTSSCIMAIRNFVSIRGQPKEFFSDNGTCFHGANNEMRIELENEFKKLDKARIQEEFTSADYSWTFNPPASPHMGGVWERMVQSVKKCLDASMTARYPTDEVLKCLFAEAANIVNSRPLTYVPLDSPDDDILTPNHFLIGSSSGCKPAGDFGDSDLLRNNWRTAQAMADKFWNKYVLEYLSTIRQRSKWTKKVESIQLNDVVLVVDENLQRNVWPKALVVALYPDKHGQVRSVQIRTSLGTFLDRPVSKLVVLDVRRNLIDDSVNLRLASSVNGGKSVENRALSS